MSRYKVELKIDKDYYTDKIVKYTVVVYEFQTTIGGEDFKPVVWNHYKTLKGAQANRDMLRKAYNCEVA